MKLDKETIINIAKESGLEQVIGSWCQECGCTDEMLIRFAETIAKIERERIVSQCISLYEKTGDTKDFNTLLIRRNDSQVGATHD